MIEVWLSQCMGHTVIIKLFDSDPQFQSSLFLKEQSENRAKATAISHSPSHTSISGLFILPSAVFISRCSSSSAASANDPVLAAS